jgi:hypothetical protein
MMGMPLSLFFVFHAHQTKSATNSSYGVRRGIGFTVYCTNTGIIGKEGIGTSIKERKC